jgi:acyl-CoA synthetase (AMP-forming)/AMP-acid ligase II
MVVMDGNDFSLFIFAHAIPHENPFSSFLSHHVFYTLLRHQRSGDVGRVSWPSGMLKITGRVKELLITAGGENVAPVPIEDALKQVGDF